MNGEPLKQIENDETRAMIRQFSVAFGRPVNPAPTTPSVTDRLLLGKLLLEETLEYIEKGLGLTLVFNDDCEVNGNHIIGGAMYTEMVDHIGQKIELIHKEGDRYNPVEAADGLGDINVIVHFNALWEGINLSAVTNEIHRSNMSKLGPGGEPLINGVGMACEGGTYYDPSKPVGKILKGPRYSPPNLLPILGIIPDEEEE